MTKIIHSGRLDGKGQRSWRRYFIEVLIQWWFEFPDYRRIRRVKETPVTTTTK